MRLSTLWGAAGAGIQAARATLEHERKLDVLARERKARDGDLLALLSDTETFFRWMDLNGGRPVPIERVGEARRLLHRLWCWGIKGPEDHPGVGAGRLIHRQMGYTAEGGLPDAPPSRGPTPEECCPPRPEAERPPMRRPVPEPPPPRPRGRPRHGG